ncbi:MAG: 4Fe-4S dicluster domain-containing protein, partial [Promethearchaeota archaeon]
MTLGEYASNMSQCIRCSNCKFIPALQIKSQQFSQICPSIDRFNFHAYSGGGRIIIANALHQGRLEVTEELRDIVYKCTMCGGCDISCKFFFGLEPLEILEELRAHCVESGVGPMPQHKQFMQSVTTHNNPYGEPHEQRFAWKPRKIKVKPSSDTAYFAGCTASYRRQEIAKATVKILDKIDYNFT